MENNNKINVSTRIYKKRTTVPVEVRDRLKIKDADSIIWSEDLIGRIYIEKEQKTEIPFVESN